MDLGSYVILEALLPIISASRNLRKWGLKKTISESTLHQPIEPSRFKNELAQKKMLFFFCRHIQAVASYYYYHCYLFLFLYLSICSTRVTQMWDLFRREVINKKLDIWVSQRVILVPCEISHCLAYSVPEKMFGTEFGLSLFRLFGAFSSEFTILKVHLMGNQSFKY